VFCTSEVFFCTNIACILIVTLKIPLVTILGSVLTINSNSTERPCAEQKKKQKTPQKDGAAPEVKAQLGEIYSVELAKEAKIQKPAGIAIDGNTLYAVDGKSIILHRDLYTLIQIVGVSILKSRS
jgi:hypothetical protein